MKKIKSFAILGLIFAFGCESMNNNEVNLDDPELQAFADGLNADIGLNPTNDGEVIRIPIPPLSEERRKELGKVASKSSEDAKVSIRSHRRYGIDEISKLKDDNSADEIKRLELKEIDCTKKPNPFSYH